MSALAASEAALAAELAVKAAAAAEEALLLSALSSGSPQSFVDLFLLTRRPRLSRDDPGETPAFMAAARDALLAGEHARHAGDLRAALASFARVGAMYAAGGQHRLAVFYHDKSLALARRAGDAAGEMQALHLMGLSREALGDLDEAVAHHRARLALASSPAAAAASEGGSEAGGAPEAARRLSAAALVRVHGVQAQLAEAQKDAAASLRLYELALDAARQSAEPAAEARANYNVGRACVMAGRAPAALPFLQAYLALSQAAPELRGNVGQALAALAAAHQAVGDWPASTASLLRLLDVALETGDVGAQAEASEQIGIMFAQQGRREEAEPHLKTAFELRRGMVAAGSCPRAALDKVRILLGMVSGDSKLGGLFSSISAIDVAGLLAWKATRVGLTAAPAEVEAGAHA
jgi:tetratricopeptide (TPR) repeat protein